MEPQGSLLFVLILLVVNDIVAAKENTNVGVKSGSRKSSKDSRIVGGKLAKIHTFPFVVSVQAFSYKEPKIISAHSCVGTLIRPDWVLTAAACINIRQENMYKIVAGSTNAYEVTNADEGMQQIRLVKKFHVHNDFDSATQANNVALIHLMTPMDPSKHVQVIKLPGQNDKQPEYGTACTLVGWGKTTSDNTIQRTMVKRIKELLEFENATTAIELLLKDHRRKIGQLLLHQAEFTIIDFAICLRFLKPPFTSDYSAYVINETFQICVNAVIGKTSCMGDMGGPLICKGHLIGISSWMKGCGMGAPDVYSKLSYFRTWIDTTIEARKM